MLCISLVVLNCHKADRLAREAGRFAFAQSEILTFETRKQDQTGADHKSSWLVSLGGAQGPARRKPSGKGAGGMVSCQGLPQRIHSNHCIHYHSLAFHLQLNHCQALRGELEQASRSKVSRWRFIMKYSEISMKWCRGPRSDRMCRRKKTPHWCGKRSPMPSADVRRSSWSSCGKGILRKRRVYQVPSISKQNHCKCHCMLQLCVVEIGWIGSKWKLLNRNTLRWSPWNGEAAGSSRCHESGAFCPCSCGVPGIGDSNCPDINLHHHHSCGIVFQNVSILNWNITNK